MSKYIIVLFLFLLTINVFSQEKQERKFRPGFLLGFNATQIDGDDLGGFNKVGLNAGAIIYFMFDHRFSLSTSILYSQKGAKAAFNLNSSANRRKIILDYIDIPIQFNFHDKEIAIFSGGLIVGRQVRYRQYDVSGAQVLENPYYDWSLGGVFNVTFLIQQKFGVNMNFQYSFVSLGEKFGESNFKNMGQYHNILGLRATYIIN